MANYMAMTGLDYDNKRVEEGDIVSDLPAKSIAWLVSQGLIVLADEVTKPQAQQKGKKIEEEIVEEKI